MEPTLDSYIKELEVAKKNVKWLLEHPNGLIDMHGIQYWAGVVERLRTLINNSI